MPVLYSRQGENHNGANLSTILHDTSVCFFNLAYDENTLFALSCNWARMKISDDLSISLFIYRLGDCGTPVFLLEKPLVSICIGTLPQQVSGLLVLPICPSKSQIVLQVKPDLSHFYFHCQHQLTPTRPRLRSAKR